MAEEENRAAILEEAGKVASEHSSPKYGGAFVIIKYIFIFIGSLRDANYYVKVMEKIKEKGSDFPTTESARLEKILGFWRLYQLLN